MSSESSTPSPLTTKAPVPPTHYTWKNYRCAYQLYTQPPATQAGIPLLLIHPIGVGLSRHFWDRFCHKWLQTEAYHPIYNPDLLGCGESDMPHLAYTPTDWAEQLQHFLQTVVQQPVILVVQGALLPVAITLVHLQTEPNWIKGLVLAGPPAWAIMTEPSPAWRQQLTWKLLDSFLGSTFYRYARRREFLRSFSARQLFADDQEIDHEWLETLMAGATNPASRYAVFSFLAGFWRQDYEAAIAAIAQPTLVIFGESASSISRTGEAETPDQRLTNYLKHLPSGQGLKIPGRNVLPYESTAEFVAAIAPFVKGFN